MVTSGVFFVVVVVVPNVMSQFASGLSEMYKRK